MADEQTTAAIAEQTAAPGAEQTVTPATEQTATAADGAGAGEAEAAPGSGAEAAGSGAEAVPSLDWSNPDTIKKLREQDRAFNAYLKQLADSSYNAGRQKRDQELRLERGYADVATAYQKHLAEKYGVELDPEDAQALPMWVASNRNWAIAETARALIKNSSSVFGIEDTSALEALLENLTPAQLEDVATQTIAAVNTTAEKKAVDRFMEALGEGDIDQHPRLHDLVKARVAREVEAELKAQHLEANKPVNPPSTTGGAADGPMTPHRFNSMNPSDRLQYILSLNDTERAEAWKLGLNRE